MPESESGLRSCTASSTGPERPLAGSSGARVGNACTLRKARGVDARAKLFKRVPLSSAAASAKSASTYSFLDPEMEVSSPELHPSLLLNGPCCGAAIIMGRSLGAAGAKRGVWCRERCSASFSLIASSLSSPSTDEL